MGKLFCLILAGCFLFCGGMFLLTTNDYDMIGVGLAGVLLAVGLLFAVHGLVKGKFDSNTAMRRSIGSLRLLSFGLTILIVVT